MKKSATFILLAMVGAIVTGGALDRARGADYRFVRMWPTLSQHWYFDTPEDVAVDPTGYVYVADAGHQSIRKYTADGVLTASWYVRTGVYSANPTGVAVDRYGNVYASASGALQKYTPDGKVIWYEPSGDYSFFYGVEADGRGWVYVTDIGLHCVHVYTADGDYLGRWGEEGMEAGQFRYPIHVAVDRDGFIYVTDRENHSVQKFEVGWENGGFFARYVDGWGEEGKADGQFNEPYGITAGADGVYVVDSLNDRVQKFDFDGALLYKWGSEGKDEGFFYAASGLDIDPDGNVVVAGRSARRIQTFTKHGEFLSSWQSHGNGKGRFENPSGVAIDADGFVYVLDKNNNQVQKFTADGQYPDGKSETEWGQEGTGPGEFDTPFGIAVFGDRVYVADTENNRIQVFQTDGTYMSQWNSAGSEGALDSPSAVAVDDQGFVYVADTDNHRILKFDPSDPNVPLLAKWGKDGGGPGTAPGEFFKPYGIAVNGKYLYIADRDNNRVQKIDTEGVEAPVTWGSYGTKTGQFKLLQGIAVANGLVYVADVENHRVQVFDEAGGFVTVIGGSGSLPGRMNGPADVAVAEDGSVYVVDSRNNRIQVFAPAGPPRIRKAIVVAAGGPFAGNDLWPATQTMANLANLVLLHQGFTDETIQYLSPDIDLDQVADITEVDADATNANLEDAITNWAKDADELVVYITNHGKTGALRMNAEETLAASRLDGWLDALQSGGDTDVVVIYDACYSGGFVSALTPPTGKRRVVMTGTDTDEDAYFIGQGAVSFSSFFWGAILSGKDLEAAVTAAEAGLDALQHPLLDGDGNGVPGEAEDLAVARTIHIGNGIDIFSQAPDIDAFAVSEPGADGGVTLLATGVADDDGIARVWVTVTPPDFEASAAEDSVLDLPDITLIPTGPTQYEAFYRGFGKKGDYVFRLYARDRLGYTTVSEKTINLNNPLRRRALLVAGYATSPEMAAAVAEAAELARSALIFQGYDDAEEIRLLTDTAGVPGADGGAGLADIQDALTGWTTGTRDLLFWFAGAGADGALQLNAGEMLTPETLDAWLAPIRNAVPGSVTVILDADDTGAAVPVLAAGPAGKSIVMASAPRDRTAVLEADGAVSFSGFFWRDILKGENAALAFRSAQDGLRLVAGVAAESGPVLEADGDGIGNEWEDTRYAADLVIGSGVRLTADIPVSQAETNAIPVTGSSPVLIRVSDVVSAAGMDAVWAVISPPDVGMGNAAASVQTRVALSPAGSGAYEATHADWLWHGPYTVAVFGRDVDGAVSRLTEFDVIRRDGVDVYEDDGVPDRIPVCVVGYPAPQHRSFHDGDDMDQVRFFAVSGEVYTLTADQVGGDCDIVMAIQNEGGQTVATENAGGSGVSEQLAWRCPETGMYTVRLTNDAAPGGADTSYEFSIDREVGAFFGYLRGRIEDAETGDPIKLAQVSTDANGTALSRESGGFLMFHQPGSFDVTIAAPGYEPVTLPATAVSEGGSTELTIKLTAVPPPEPPEPPTPPGDPDSFPVATMVSPSGDQTVTAGESVDFRGRVSSGDAPFFYSWDFDGAAPNSDQRDPGSVVFEEPGTYRVAYRVTDADGDVSETFVTITVTAKPDEPGPDPDPDPEPEPVDTVPEAAIVSPSEETTIVQGESVRFEGAASGGDGALIYRWTFDGAASDSYVLTPGEVMFSAPGNFTVRFIAVDEDGDRSEAAVLVTVLARTPKPTLLEPADGAAEVPLPPVLFADEDTDPPAAFFHDTTRWQIAEDAGFSTLVLDRTTDRHLTALALPDLLLEPDREYYWRVQFNFEDGSVSEWSDAARFSTVVNDSDDLDGDGIADWQVVATADRGDAPAEAVCVRAGEGGSVLCLTGLENVAVVAALRAVPTADISETENRPQSLPLGLLTFRLRAAEPGAPVVVRIDFPRPVTVDMGWHGYDLFAGWHTDPDAYAFAPDNASVTLTLRDGGPFDLDGVVNGIILLAPSGPGTAPLSGGALGFDGPGGNVGGGCFIESAGW